MKPFWGHVSHADLHRNREISLLQACVECGHDEAGRKFVIESALRRLFRLRPAPYRCFLEEPFGGGMEVSAYCECDHPFHS